MVQRNAHLPIGAMQIHKWVAWILMSMGGLSSRLAEIIIWHLAGIMIASGTIDCHSQLEAHQCLRDTQQCLNYLLECLRSIQMIPWQL